MIDCGCELRLDELKTHASHLAEAQELRILRLLLPLGLPNSEGRLANSLEVNGTPFHSVLMWYQCIVHERIMRCSSALPTFGMPESVRKKWLVISKLAVESIKAEASRRRYAGALSAG